MGASGGWHVERETLQSDLRPGGHRHQIKILGDARSPHGERRGRHRVLSSAAVIENQRITADQGIDPNVRMKNWVQVVKTERDGPLVRRRPCAAL